MFTQQQMYPIYPYNPYANQQYNPIQPHTYYKDKVVSTNEFYPVSGCYGTVFNQQQMRVIDEINAKIPLFGLSGKPMNKAAGELTKVIDHRIAECEKTKARNRRKTK